MNLEIQMLQYVDYDIMMDLEYGMFLFSFKDITIIKNWRKI
ncbi:hypothetical protein [Finegoldia magna]|nr:hypothetical protein [Finegoldia magna]